MDSSRSIRKKNDAPTPGQDTKAKPSKWRGPCFSKETTSGNKTDGQTTSVEQRSRKDLNYWCTPKGILEALNTGQGESLRGLVIGTSDDLEDVRREVESYLHKEEQRQKE